MIILLINYWYNFRWKIGYVLFYNFDYYLNNLFDIFKIWQGGMSFHGGLIG